MQGAQLQVMSIRAQSYVDGWSYVVALPYDTLACFSWFALKQGYSSGAHFTYSRPQLDSDSSSPSEGRDFVQVGGQGPFRSDSPTLDDYVVVPPEIPSDCSGNLILPIVFHLIFTSGISCWQLELDRCYI